VIYHQCEVAKAVNDRDVKNCPILAENRVSEKRAYNGQKVSARNEYVIPAICVCRSHQQLVRHKHHQDGIHPIVTEPFGGFVPDYVRHARRHFVGLERSGKVFGFGHLIAWTIPKSQQPIQSEFGRTVAFVLRG
jgi:hypothetical protein